MSQDFSKVRTGIGLIYLAMLLQILVVVLSGVVFASYTSPGKIWMMPGLRLLGTAISFLGYVGMIFCLGVPREMPRRALITSSVALTTVAMLLAARSAYLDVLEPYSHLDPFERGVMAFHLISLVLHLVSFVLFLLFLRSLARFLAVPHLGARAIGLIKLGVVIILAAIVGGGVVFMYAMARFGARLSGRGGPDNSLSLELLFLVPLLAMSLLFVIRYAGLLSGLRSALDRSMS